LELCSDVDSFPEQAICGVHRFIDNFLQYRLLY